LGQPFPNSEECKKLETSKFGQYSCTQLLREMEASLSNAEDESMGVAGMEDELVMLSEALLEKAREYQSGATLPENLYVLHESTEVQMQDQVHVSSLEKLDQGCNMNNKKWGSILVEKRTSKHQLDGKTVMEKAQERKKKADLDGYKGNSKTYNPLLILSCSDISNMAEVTGVSLGKDTKEIENVIGEMQLNDEKMALNFKDKCEVCQTDSVVGPGVDAVDNVTVREGGDAPVTPVAASDPKWRVVMSYKVSGPVWSIGKNQN
jgi:hypothetical protein